MAQVNSVAQLQDVRPSDWAFQALQALVERYGVIKGFPDGSFRGNQPLTRYEFAATLRAVIAAIDQRLDLGQEVERQDIATIQRLVAASGQAVGELRTRLYDLTGRISHLESRNFSATTKLQGQSVQAFTWGTDAEATILSRVRLDLLTSFDGRDRLTTQIEVGNSGGDAISLAQSRRQNLLGRTGALVNGGGLDYVGISSSPYFRKLFYQFQPLPEVAVAVGAKLVPSDFIDRNRFANGSAVNFSSSFFAHNPLIVQNQIDLQGGAGAAVTWTVNPSMTLRALYLAADANSPDQGGLWGDRYQGSVELEYAASRDMIFRLQYTNALINGSRINAGGINAEWAYDRQLSFFLRYGVGSYQGFNRVVGQELDLSPQTWAVGAAIRNLLIPGSQAGIALGQPFVEGKLGNATQTNFEAFYSLFLNDNVNFSPSLLVVTNPNNRTSPTIWQGSFKLVFSF